MYVYVIDTSKNIESIWNIRMSHIKGILKFAARLKYMQRIKEGFNILFRKPLQYKLAFSKKSRHYGFSNNLCSVLWRITTRILLIFEVLR